MPSNLFTYGTLTFPEVWRRIDVGEFPSQRATLPGFSIYRVKDAVFPGIVRAEPDDHVNGVLYLDLDDDALFELDAYESDLYDRIPVIAATDEGPVECTAFVIPDSRRHALSNEVWDAERFEKHQLAKYLHG
jgi:gamma-glutamylcyclotransferase (GGCT)/AIG2-like uncharacterized protein YtfP